MNKALFDVVHGCLSNAFVAAMAKKNQPSFAGNTFAEHGELYPVHFKTGKRAYELYANLDQGDDNNALGLAVLMRDVYQNSTYLPLGVPNPRWCAWPERPMVRRQGEPMAGIFDFLRSPAESG
jgi:hypothetical protein